MTKVTKETLWVYACTNVEVQLTKPVEREIDLYFDTKIDVLGHRLDFNKACDLADGLRAILDAVCEAVEAHNYRMKPRRLDMDETVRDIEKTFYRREQADNIEKDLTNHG